ncbi:tetratricopeptide repeat protein [Tenacibaculum agarivorans]|uniref:tetratricopeptide repeat protein n=1 Tax=Tenacibaculum agarivorans TaxID=1908389 RepID=UPI00094BB1A0|nr:tetratricopeptide repeat protein [Tenacibaculum agarivorans]
MKTKLTCIFLLLQFATVLAQKQDSLLTVLKDNIDKSTSDSSRIYSKIEFVKQAYKFDVDTSRVILNEVFDFLHKESEGNTYYTASKVTALNYKGILDVKQDKLEEGLGCYLQALDLSEKIKDSVGMWLSLHNLAMFFRKQREFEKSKDYFHKAIGLKKSIDDVEKLALTYHMLGVTYYENKKLDSAIYYINKTKALPCLAIRKTKANATLAGVYYSQKKYDQSIAIYKENIKILKGTVEQNELSVGYLNVAVLLNVLKEYDKALPYLDSAITVAKKMQRKDLLLKQYSSRSNLNETRKDYKQALSDYRIAMAYHDSINDIEKAKRVTALALNYKFDKEKIIDALRLENERSKKKLYLLALICIVILSGIILWLFRKNAKQQIHLTQTRLQQRELEKVKAELSLVTKEKELKNAVVENSIKQEIFKKTLNDIKTILKLESEQDRKKGLHSLTASLLSEKVVTNSDLKSYLDKVSFDFKVKLDTKFPQLNEREKEILCLMTLELNTNEISKLQNSSISAVKSSRSRIRKKIGVTSKEDIITFVKNTHL